MNSLEMIVIDNWCVGCGSVPDRYPPLVLKDSCAQTLRLLVTVSSPATSHPPWKVAGSAHIQCFFHVGFKGLARLPHVEQLWGVILAPELPSGIIWGLCCDYIAAQSLSLLSSSTFTLHRYISPKHFLINIWTCKCLPESVSKESDQSQFIR